MLRANPPNCPPEFARMAERAYGGEPNKLVAVVICKPEEDQWIDSWLRRMFDSSFLEMVRFRPDTHQISMLILANH